MVDTLTNCPESFQKIKKEKTPRQSAERFYYPDGTLIVGIFASKRNTWVHVDDPDADQITADGGVVDHRLSQGDLQSMRVTASNSPDRTSYVKRELGVQMPIFQSRERNNPFSMYIALGPDGQIIPDQSSQDVDNSLTIGKKRIEIELSPTGGGLKISRISTKARVGPDQAGVYVKKISSMGWFR